MDFYGLLVLLLTAVVISALQVAAIFGTMFAIHKFAADKVEETGWGTFSFDHITKPALSELLARLSAIVFPPTILLHLLIFILFPFPGTHPFRKYALTLSVILFILEIGTIGVGLFYIMKFDRVRFIVLTTASAIFYLLLYWLLLYRDLYS